MLSRKYHLLQVAEEKENEEEEKLKWKYPQYKLDILP